MSNFRIEEVPPQPVLEIADRISMLGIPKMLGNAFPRIKAHVEGAGGELAGPPFARYLGHDWESVRNDGMLAQLWALLTQKISIRAGFPTAAPMTAADGMVSSEFAPGRCVCGTHFGPYHKVGETYKELLRWADDNKLTLANDSLERYVNDPSTVPSAEIETHVFVPVRG